VTLGELTIPVVWAGAAHLAMWSAGTWIRARIVRDEAPGSDRAETAFQSAMLGFAVCATATFFLGVLRLLHPALLAGAIAILAAWGAPRLVRSILAARRAPTLSDLPLIAAFGYVLAHVPRAVIPVLEHDENVYHLLLPKLYLQSHTLTALPWSLGANMPHLVDLSYVLPTAFGGFTAAKVFALGFMLWTFVGMAPFGRAMLGPMGPGILAILYLSGPIIQYHFGLAYVEPIISALLLGAVLCLYRFWTEGRRSDAILLAAFAGAACASKYTVWPLTLVLFGLVAIAPGPDGRRAGWRLLPLLFGVAAVFVLPWLVKNAVITGNPIYPNAPGLLGGTYWSETLSVQFQHEMGYGRGAERDWLRYAGLPYHLVVDPFTGILGGAAFSAGMMVLILVSLALPWKMREFGSALRILTIAAYVFWCLGPKQTRYLMVGITVMTVTAGLALVPLRRWRPAIPAATIAVVAAALIQLRLQPFPAEPILDAFRVSRADLLARNLGWDLSQLLNAEVPPTGRVLTFWENRLYFLDRPFMADSAYGAPAMLGALRAAGDPHVFAQKMAAQGITHVVVNPFFYQHYMANGFRYSLIDDTYYTESQLAADKALLDRFINTELTHVPRESEWAVFRLGTEAP
jgi:hypothetical protein